MLLLNKIYLLHSIVTQEIEEEEEDETGEEEIGTKEKEKMYVRD